MSKKKTVKVKVLSEVFEYKGKKYRKGNLIDMPVKEAGTLESGGHVEYVKRGRD